MTEKTDYRSLYDRLYIGAWDLQGKEVTVTIIGVSGAELITTGGRKNKKPVITFDGKEKKFVANKTNSKTIAALYGNYVESWVGKRITLYVSTTRNPEGGDDVQCIRIRPQVPAAKSEGAIP